MCLRLAFPPPGRDKQHWTWSKRDIPPAQNVRDTRQLLTKQLILTAVVKNQMGGRGHWVSQVVDRLPSEPQALSSNPSTTKQINFKK
jgi:hypothetical protein